MNKKKLITLLSGLSAAIALSLCLYIHLIDVEQKNLANNLRLEETRLETNFTNRILGTFTIAQTINLQIAAKPKDQNNINNILQKFQTSEEARNNFSWTIFSWTDENHQLVIDAKYGILKDPIDLSERDCVPLAKKEPNKFHLGIPVLGATSKKWMIPGSLGAIDENGKYLGAIVIGFEIESLAQAFQKELRSDDIEFELIPENKVNLSILRADKQSFIVSKNNLPTEEKSIISSFRKADQLSLNNIFDAKLIGAKPHAILVKKIDNSPYFFALKYKTENLEGRVKKLLILQLISTAIIFFICVATPLYILKKKRF